MKKYILLLCLSSFFSVFVLAQENDASLKVVDSLTKKMFDAINDRDFEAVVEISHPKIFDLVSKENLITSFKTMFEGNEEFSINIPKVTPDYKISAIKKINDTDYAFVTYDLNMTMTFNKQTFDEDSKQMMKNMMKAQGMDVEFVSDNALNILIKDSITILLNDELTNNKWVMINYNADSPIFYQVVSSEIIEQAKAYKQNLLLERKKQDEKND